MLKNPVSHLAYWCGISQPEEAVLNVIFKHNGTATRELLMKELSRTYQSINGIIRELLTAGVIKIAKRVNGNREHYFAIQDDLIYRMLATPNSLDPLFNP